MLIQLRGIALLLLVSISSGCASTSVEYATVSQGKPSGSAQPAYIVPNCRMIGAEHVCQWIDPPRSGNKEPVRKVPGIAL
jgi:hypothetical protein